jgi:DNA replication protein DnaC
MLNEETYNKLVALQLHGLAAAFKSYLDQPVGRDELAFEERFGIFVDREWTERQQRRLANRLKGAKLRESACLEDVDFRHPRGLDRSVVQRLATCAWVKAHEAVILTGATGLGKTWLACALAHQACREGYTVTYTRVPRLLHTLGLARADGSYVRELARLAKADVLVLDDWALAPMGEVERRDLLEILEDRHGLRSTIVTSQVPVAKWHDAIGDPTIADAILDRLVHRAHRLELSGPSLRKAARKGDADG